MPQRLKPSRYCWACGSDESVPFQNCGFLINVSGLKQVAVFAAGNHELLALPLIVGPGLLIVPHLNGAIAFQRACVGIWNKAACEAPKRSKRIAGSQKWRRG
jgi:hypothetical protein